MALPRQGEHQEVVVVRRRPETVRRARGQVHQDRKAVPSRSRMTARPIGCAPLGLAVALVGCAPDHKDFEAVCEGTPVTRAPAFDPDTTETELLNGLLVPYPEQEMTAYPVADTVNSPRNDVSECIIPTVRQPVPEPTQLSLL